jgi:hypothetical protein
MKQTVDRSTLFCNEFKGFNQEEQKKMIDDLIIMKTLYNIPLAITKVFLTKDGQTDAVSIILRISSLTFLFQRTLSKK